MSEESEEFEEGSSFSSRNSKTLGIFFAGSSCLSSEAACGGFKACLDRLPSGVSLEDWPLSTLLALSTGPFCGFVAELETVDDVLFLPSFFVFLVRRL